MGGQFLNDSELAKGIADEKGLHEIIFSSLKAAADVYHWPSIKLKNLIDQVSVIRNNID